MQSTKESDVVRGSFDLALSDHVHGCQSSLLTLGGQPSDTVFFTQPLTPSRHTMTVHRSVDGGASWPDYMVVATGGASYSCMSTLPGDDSRMGLLYERDGPLCTHANDTTHPTVARSMRAVCHQSCPVAGCLYRDSPYKRACAEEEWLALNPSYRWPATSSSRRSRQRSHEARRGDSREGGGGDVQARGRFGMLDQHILFEWRNRVEFRARNPMARMVHRVSTFLDHSVLTSSALSS
jgi:hypothetical protein